MRNLSSNDKAFAFLRFISVIGGVFWVYLHPLYSDNLIIYYTFFTFSIYSLALFALINRKPLKAAQLYRSFLLFDFLFILVLINYTGGLHSNFYYAFYILASLHTFYFGTKTGLTIAGLGTLGYLALGYQQYNQVYLGDIALEMSFLLMVILTIGYLNKQQQASNRQLEESLIENAKLYQETKEQALEKAMLYEEMKEMYFNIVQGFVAAIDAKDAYTKGHSEKVTVYSKAIAEKLGLPQKEVDTIANAALLHDIGKIGIDEKILHKPGGLNIAELDLIKHHPTIGAQILSKVKSLEAVIPIIYHHHERYDGQGYIEGLKEKDVPLGSRIIAVADAYEAMTSNRPYRRTLTQDEAILELRKCAGTQFDPEIVEIFVSILKQDTYIIKEVI